MNIVIISPSVRTGRNSHRVALFFKNYIETNELASVELIDLNDYHFPIFEERLRNIKNPTTTMLDFSHKISNADGVIIVTPEYNGGYPASLKNAIDLLNNEWKRKPVAVVTASIGPLGGAHVATSLLFSLWILGAWIVPAMYPVPWVEAQYEEDGDPTDKGAAEKRAKYFIDELFSCMEARTKMQPAPATFNP